MRLDRVEMMAVPTGAVHPADMNADEMSILADLQRYAGWLGKDFVSNEVRDDLRELASAMRAGSDASSWLQRLDKDIERLQSGGVRKMLRKSLRALQAALGVSRQSLTDSAQS
jgi:hypothetical protein